MFSFLFSNGSVNHITKIKDGLGLYVCVCKNVSIFISNGYVDQKKEDRWGVYV